MKTKQLIIALSTALFSNVLLAHNIQVNSPLPAVSVQKDGEINLNGDKVQYQGWHSAQLVGKVRVVQHFAGRTAAKEKNEALIQAIKQAGFDRNKYQTTSIINADDAVIGTGIFVKNSAEKGKKENAHSQVILDQQSAVKNAWQLREKDSAVIVLDKTGKVQFVAEGKLSVEHVKEVIDLVGKLIK
ncbi:YtfJ family protein [Lonepinella sp. BR2357]|uniref:YtfJ family protein n=1 Tax=Lonepinella sp. BR2357 TaxID=3434549 RepID=UPI003F6DC9B2